MPYARELQDAYPGRRRQALVDPAPAAGGPPVDWSDWYLIDEEDMGEGGEQLLIIRALVSCLAELARERGWRDVFIGADQFFAWVEHEPLVRVSPDIYLLDYIPKRPLPASWQTWLPGHRPPTLALEIVSDEGWAKDYRENPAKYAQLGAQELVIFDPEAALGRKRKSERVALQVYRWEEQAFVRAYQGAGPAYCRELDAWLSVQREEAAASLGIARDAAGQDLVASTEQVRDQAEQARDQAEHALSRERAARDEERIERERVERLLAEARAELERVKSAQNAM